jgi:hypothetical protein
VSSAPLSVPGSASIECSPPVGNSPGSGPIPTASRAISIIPSHHSGIEYSVSEAPVDTLSKEPPRFQAPRTPSHTPITAARIVEVPTSSSVGHIRSTSSSETGTRYLSEMPRSPVAVFRRNVRNCCGSGWSRP